MYNVAIYCRLSQEDGKDESQSISSQKDIITNYVKSQNWHIYDYYVDDGFSGTNFNRPGFNRLIKDIKLGRVNLVVTKDLSRLGRNYLYTGYLTEEFFPSNNIRYVAICDGYDSLGDKGGDFMPFRNVINEWYAKDVSKKIRFTLDGKARAGEPQKTVFPIYGYKFNDKNERIIDEETSQVVKLIYKKYIECASTTNVASFLRENKIHTPRYYNAIKYGYNKAKILLSGKEYDWTNKSVREIIIKEEYKGSFITAKTKSISFKNKKRIKNQNRFVFEDKYIPLIDKQTWQIANEMLKKSKSSNVLANENTYKGILFCESCNKPLRFERRFVKSKIAYRYFCNNKSCKSSNSVSKKYLDYVITKEISLIKNKITKQEFERALKNNENKIIKVNLDKDNSKKLNEINKKIEFVIENANKGIIPADILKNIIDKYQKEKEFYNTKNNLMLFRDETSKNNSEINLESVLSLNDENLLNHANIVKILDKVYVSCEKQNGVREIILKVKYNWYE